MNYGGIRGRMRKIVSQGGGTKTGFQAFPLSYRAACVSLAMGQTYSLVCLCVYSSSPPTGP